MSGEDEGQARYWRNKNKADKKTFRYEAETAMSIATDLTISREARLIALGNYIKECCVDF